MGKTFRGLFPFETRQKIRRATLQRLCPQGKQRRTRTPAAPLPAGQGSGRKEGSVLSRAGCVPATGWRTVVREQQAQHILSGGGAPLAPQGQAAPRKGSAAQRLGRAKARPRKGSAAQRLGRAKARSPARPKLKARNPRDLYCAPAGILDGIFGPRTHPWAAAAHVELLQDGKRVALVRQRKRYRAMMNPAF